MITRCLDADARFDTAGHDTTEGDSGPFNGADCSVALDGGTVAVGALQEDSVEVGVDGDQTDDSAADAGAVYVLR